MLKGTNPILSPALLKILAEMGHGDEIVLADAHFPGHTFCRRHVLRGDGLQTPDLLDGILPLFELDRYAEPLIMMAAVEGAARDPRVEPDYMTAIRGHAPHPIREDRFVFCERAKKAYACAITGTTTKDGDIVLKKGVTNCE